jgi:hypothetical protein
VTLSGHLVPGLKGVSPLPTPLSPHQVLHLSIGLTVRNQDALNTLLREQDTPKSKLYHHYLTPQRYAATFGQPQSAVNTVVAFLRNQGLHVSSVSTNHTMVFADGTVAAVEKAFALTIAQYKYNGRVVYAPVNEPSVPASLGNIVSSVVGLDDAVTWHRSPLPRPQHRTTRTAQPAYNNCFPNETYGYRPADFYGMYDITPLIDTGYDGTGQSVAIVEFDGYDTADVATFDSCFGLPAASIYPEYLATGASPSPQSGKGAAEAELDMEVFHEIAPGANEVMYVGKNDGSAGNGSVLISPPDEIQVYNQIVSDNIVSAISSSWSIGCEEKMLQSQRLQIDTILEQGAAQGIAFLDASGDTGPLHACGTGGVASLDVIEADPHVIAVGGTTDHEGGTETYWYNNQYLAGGYGTSAYVPAPFYQASVGITGMRSVPDVAADADLNTGYAEYCYDSGIGGYCPGWFEDGGTSAAAPLWAGVVADINTYLNAIQRPTLGNAISLLYLIYNDNNSYPYKAFNDITSGCYGSSPCAGTGFDTVTGMGSPDAWNLAQDIQAQIATNIESDVVWGKYNGSSNTTDLMFSYTQSNSPGWRTPVDISAQIRSATGENLSLNGSLGQPAFVSYQTPGDGAEVDAFALANVSNTPSGYHSSNVLYGFAYIPSSGAWSDLGPIGSSGALQPAHNPVAVEVGSATDPAVTLFGIAPNGHLIEFYLSNNQRQSGGYLQAFHYTDITNQTGVICDPGISPAATNYRSIPLVFADCNNQLVDFYPNSQGTWVANTGIVGHNIPNASHAFPYHSIATMSIPGSPSALEAYVASDQNGAIALSEYLYNGSTWSAYALGLASGSIPDQVYASTVLQTNGATTPISQVVVTNPAATCSSLPSAEDHLYKSGWQHSDLPTNGITSMQAIVQQSGDVFTAAYTGAYTGAPYLGEAGGAGCSDPNGGYIDENDYVLSTQQWYWAQVPGGQLDDAGLEPIGTEFAY